MRKLKKGDIVAHISKPDICGCICEITNKGYIVDYSNSLPKKEVKEEEILLIKTAEETEEQQETEQKKGLTSGFINITVEKNGNKSTTNN